MKSTIHRALDFRRSQFFCTKLKLILFVRGCCYDCYLLCRDEKLHGKLAGEKGNTRSSSSRSGVLGVREAVIGCAATALPSSAQHGRCYIRNGMIYEHHAEGEVNCERRIEIAIIQEISRCRVACERALPSRDCIRYTSILG